MVDLDLDYTTLIVTIFSAWPRWKPYAENRSTTAFVTHFTFHYSLLTAPFGRLTLGSELIPDAYEGQAGFQVNQQPSLYTPVHAAISVPVSLEEIERIGTREGWRVFPCNRDGLFDVVEFWIENRLMLELLTPAITPTYLSVFHPDNVEKFATEFAAAPTKA